MEPRYFVVFIDDEMVKNIREFKTLSQVRDFYPSDSKINNMYAFKVDEHGMEEI